MSGKIIVRTMNVGMCNQLFTYAFARYLCDKYDKELWLDYSNTNILDMKHNAMYDDSLANFDLAVAGVIKDRDDYLSIAGKNGAKLESLLHPFLVRRKHRNSYFINKENKNFVKYAKNGLFLNFVADSDNSYYEELPAENGLLYGYWQVPNFARSIENILKKEIVRPITSLIENMEISNVLKEMRNSTSVCIHIRRGDYVGDKTHDVCTVNYYKNAVQEMCKKYNAPTFYVFSDNLENVKTEYNIFENCKVVYCDYKLKDYIELILMSNCKAFIMSNSSFSWWAQFLSGSDSVIAPSKWYGDVNKKTLLYEKHWKLMEV